MHPAQRRYWLRIATGALAIFGIGMGIIFTTRQGLGLVRSASRALSGIPLAMLPVRVDGQELGTLRQIDVEANAQDSAAVHITVRASDSLLGERFEHCLLVPSGGSGRRKYSDFKCLSPTDSAGADLRKVGEIVVEPSGMVLDFLVPAKQLAGWRHGRAMGDSDVKSVRIQADSSGAVIDVRGRGGRKLFHLEADSGGARISVHDDSIARPAKR
jgi:hypothetical protein